MSHPPSHEDSPLHEEPPSPPLHIPGAGAAGIALLLVSLSVLFLASILVYVIVRAQIMHRMNMNVPVWPPAGLPLPPKSLWFSTLIILASSVTIQLALAAVRRDDDKQLNLFLLITFALGLLFLLLQAFNWFEFYQAIPPANKLEGPYLGMFFTLTGLHAAHVIGGLIPLAVVLFKARSGRYSRNFHPGVRYSAIYWHFLDIIWLALFTLLCLL